MAAQSDEARGTREVDSPAAGSRVFAIVITFSVRYRSVSRTIAEAGVCIAAIFRSLTLKTRDNTVGTDKRKRHAPAIGFGEMPLLLSSHTAARPLPYAIRLLL